MCFAALEKAVENSESQHSCGFCARAGDGTTVAFTGAAQSNDRPTRDDQERCGLEQGTQVAALEHVAEQDGAQSKNDPE